MWCLGVAMFAAVCATVVAVPRSSLPRQCPDEVTTGCSLPHWDVRYGMRNSGYVYCFETCPLEFLANNTNSGLFGGVVGVDHYWTHQGMPCVNGIPQEFAMQSAFAKATKTTFPRAKVLEYRITDAVPYDAVVHDKMVANPDFFVRWHHAPDANGSICTVPPEHQTGLPGDNCSWLMLFIRREIKAGAYDWSQQAVQDWYLENIIKPVMINGDGAWIDGDGPDNGCYQFVSGLSSPCLTGSLDLCCRCSGTYDYANLPAPYPALNSTEIAAFCVGEAAVVTAAQTWLIANGGFDYNCFHFVTSGLPTASDNASTCVSKIIALQRLSLEPTATVLYGTRTNSVGYDDSTVKQAAVTFLLVRGDYWYFGYPATNTIALPTAALLLSDYGFPLGNMTLAGTVFSRAFQNATVAFDCAHFAATITPTNNVVD